MAERLPQALENMLQATTEASLDTDDNNRDKNLLNVLLATGITEDAAEEAGFTETKASPEQLKRAIENLGL